MTNEELNNCIQELITLIQNQNFQGTSEEIIIQQIMFFDKYVKENIDYGFDAVNYSIANPNSPNPFDSAFRLEGFFKENEINGQRLAVCGSISHVAKIVFNAIGIKCDYVWGHFNSGTELNPQYVGHRWNVVEINDKQYMVDFTAGMIIRNMGKDSDYTNCAYQILGVNSIQQEYEYLFFDKLGLKQSIGGFTKNENGTTIDDIDENGFLKNTTKNAQELFPNLSVIPDEIKLQYIPQSTKIL